MFRKGADRFVGIISGQTISPPVRHWHVSPQNLNQAKSVCESPQQLAQTQLLGCFRDNKNHNIFENTPAFL
jgi:hypothetical protein